MSTGDSPTIARRHVRMALREAREAAGLTQHDVAEEMEWSLSKVIRIENGDVTFAPNDLRPLLRYLGVADRATIASLQAAAKTARARQRQAWYQAPQFREHTTDALRRLIEYEAEAASIRSYSVLYLPGALQVPEYSRALVELWSGELSKDQIRCRLEAHRMRREALLGRLGAIRLTVLVDESVLMRPIGGAGVLAAQLRELAILADRALVSIRMMPFAADAAMSYNAGFDLLYLGDDRDTSSAVMYRENGFTDEIVEDRGTTERHHTRYQQLWAIACNEEDTMQFISKRIGELEALPREPR